MFFKKNKSKATERWDRQRFLVEFMRIYAGSVIHQNENPTKEREKLFKIDSGINKDTLAYAQFYCELLAFDNVPELRDRTDIIEDLINAYHQITANLNPDNPKDRQELNRLVAHGVEHYKKMLHSKKDPDKASAYQLTKDFYPILGIKKPLRDPFRASELTIFLTGYIVHPIINNILDLVDDGELVIDFE